MRVRPLICLALALALLPFLSSPGNSGPAKAKTEEFKGKIVSLKDLLEKAGTKLDPEAAPQWLALATDDGRIYPLIRDGGARLFFLDNRLLNRPMKISGRFFGDTKLLQVLSVNSVVDGKLHEIYYWCDTCAIRRNEKLQRCDCCGGPLELKEEPVK